MRFNVKFLTLTHAVTEQVGLLCILRRQTALPEIVVSRRERGVSHREIRIQANGALKKRNCAGVVAFSSLHFSSLAEGLQGVERGRGGLFDRRVEFLHGAE